MTVYLIEDIVKDVRIALDQNMTSDALTAIGDVDTLSLNELITSKIVEAVKHVHSQAPIHLLDTGYNFGYAIYWKDLESGYVLLPDDFMRLIVFQMDDWERPVLSAISTDDPIYHRQTSRFKGVRGTSQRPVCAITIRPEGKALEFYSCKSNEATVSRAIYLPYPVIDAFDSIEICKLCYSAVVYTTAELVLTTFGDAAKSAAFSELAKASLV